VYHIKHEFRDTEGDQQKYSTGNAVAPRAGLPAGRGAKQQVEHRTTRDQLDKKSPGEVPSNKWNTEPQGNKLSKEETSVISP